jgi:hypothetical protein
LFAICAPRLRWVRIGYAFGPLLVAVEKGRTGIFGEVNGDIADGDTGTTQRAYNEDEQLLGGEIDLRHVTDGSAEGKEIGAEVVVGRQIGAKMREVLALSAADLVTHAKTIQVADKLQFRPIVPKED